MDASNATSVRYAVPAGAFDVDQLAGRVDIRFAAPDDRFTPLGEPDEAETQDERSQHMKHTAGRKAVAVAAGMAAALTLVLEARGLVKRYGPVTAIAMGDLELYPNEILAVIGDNGAGKTSLIKALCGALIRDEGEILLDG